MPKITANSEKLEWYDVPNANYTISGMMVKSGMLVVSQDAFIITRALENLTNAINKRRW